MSLAPTIGGSVWLAETKNLHEEKIQLSHGLRKNKTSVRKKYPVKPMPACKNLVVQVKLKLVCDMYYIHDCMY